MRDRLISRRRFLGGLATGAALALAGAPMLGRAQAPAGLTTPDMRVISLEDKAYRDLKTVGKGIYLPVDLQEMPLILWRQSDTSVKAFLSTCTHKVCRVGLPNRGVLKCPCCGSQFDENGKQTQGPAKKPLTEFRAQLENGKITIDMRAPIS